MKTRITVLFAALLSLAASINANTWTGTMSWTLTSLSGPDPYGQIGDIFTGSYSYQSPTEDYDSYLDPTYGQDVSITCAIPNWMHWPADPDGTTQILLEERFHLAVNDGVVTFYDTGDMTTADYDFWQDHMTFEVTHFSPWDGLRGTGTVQFSSPTDITKPELADSLPANVPDGGSTLAMLGSALMGLAAFWRRFAA